MFDYLDIDGFRLHETTIRSVSKVTGLSGIPAIRGATYDRPEADGEVEPTNQYKKARIVTVTGEVWGTDIPTAWTNWRAVAQKLNECMDTPKVLTWQDGGAGLSLQTTVRTIGDLMTEQSADENGPYIGYFWTARASDPLLTAQASQLSAASAPVAGSGMPLPVIFPIPFGSASGGTTTALNGGHVKAWPLITITGPIVNPVVGNTTTNRWLYFDTLSLAAGETLLINTNPANRYATVAGISKLGAIRFADSQWPFMTPGVSETWQFYGLGGGYTGSTTMTVSWRNSYIA